MEIKTYITLAWMINFKNKLKIVPPLIQVNSKEQKVILYKKFNRKVKVRLIIDNCISQT